MPVAELEAPPAVDPLAPVVERDDAPTRPKVVPGAAHGLPDGARMTRAEYHRLYEQTPPGFRAELIGGTVHVRRRPPKSIVLKPGGGPPGTISEPHATFQKWLTVWLWEYEKRTPGVESLCPLTLPLDDDAEPEPDALLRRRPVRPGETAGDAAAGDETAAAAVEPPGLVAEVAVSSLATDLGAKFRDYHAAGVGEYVVFDVRGRRVRWFARDADGVFVDLTPGADGFYKSREFPGLWLDPAAFFAEDAAGLEAAVAAGVAARDAA